MLDSARRPGNKGWPLWIDIFLIVTVTLGHRGGTCAPAGPPLTQVYGACSPRVQSCPSCIQENADKVAKSGDARSRHGELRRGTGHLGGAHSVGKAGTGPLVCFFIRGVPLGRTKAIFPLFALAWLLPCLDLK